MTKKKPKSQPERDPRLTNRVVTKKSFGYKLYWYYIDMQGQFWNYDFAYRDFK